MWLQFLCTLHIHTAQSEKEEQDKGGGGARCAKKATISPVKKKIDQAGRLVELASFFPSSLSGMSGGFSQQLTACNVIICDINAEVQVGH